MKHLLKFNTERAYKDFYLFAPKDCVAMVEGHIHYSRSNSAPCLPQISIQELIDEGYATVVPQTDGFAIQILDTCPYELLSISDLIPILTNHKQIDQAKNSFNTLIWRTLPNNWEISDIVNIYNNNSLNIPPVGGIFGLNGSGPDMRNIDNLSITFDERLSWKHVCNYPWGEFTNTRGFNLFGGNEQTPKEFTIHFKESMSSVGQRIFQYMRNTKKINIICDKDFLCHDYAGMFEGCSGLETITLQGRWYWNGMNNNESNIDYLFNGCRNLTEIPLSPLSSNREDACNTLCPYKDTRGSSALKYSFQSCDKLQSIKPTINMSQVSSATDYVQFYTPKLTDVRLKNLNNTNWSFINTKSYIPNMDVASIEYLLNNVADCSSNPHTITFSTLHEGEISQAAINNAASKGWTVIFGTQKYSRNFTDWQINTSALADYQVTDTEIVISKFKPNVWLMKYTPELEEDQTMNQAVFNYAHNFEVVISGIENITGENMPISWYKTNNDAGGYFCRGILIAPFNSSNRNCVTAYPWEMGVPGGGFKNPNNGAHYYGYTLDGFQNLYAYNSTHTYPENTAAYLGLGIYTGSQTDSNGYITLDTPIRILLCNT